MNDENFDYLKRDLEKRGWESLVPELKEKMGKGEVDFVLDKQGEIEGCTTETQLVFRKHPEHYFNRINAALFQGEELLAKASVRPAWGLDNEEIGRLLLYGNKVAVYKEGIKNEAGEKFNAYIAVNVDQPLDENGFLNLNTYHDNYYKKYPFIVEDSLKRVTPWVKELQSADLGETSKVLKSGLPIPVTVETDGTSQPGYITLNAKIGRVDILDSEFEPIALPKKQIKETQEQELTGQKDKPDEKKKLPANQRTGMNWNRPKAQSKRMRP